MTQVSPSQIGGSRRATSVPSSYARQRDGLYTGGAVRRVAAGSLRPIPFDDPVEEHFYQSEPLTDGIG